MFLLIARQSQSACRRTAISIHLMFLLIISKTNRTIFTIMYFNTSHVSINLYTIHAKCHSSADFNTSHVSINPEAAADALEELLNFNTSHVSINPFSHYATKENHRNFNTSHVSINPAQDRSKYVIQLRISIHLMFLLINSAYPTILHSAGISIHLMFLLIARHCLYVFIDISISIHLMFLLIRKIKNVKYELYRISIHLMFLLIYFRNFAATIRTNFNTSHVSINPSIRSTLSRRRVRISIHLMFLLINSNGEGRTGAIQFQYISCFY